MPPEAYQVDHDLKADIRFIKGSHFALGNDEKCRGAEHFVTLNEATYTKLGMAQAKMSKAVMLDLRKSHFGLGGVSQSMKSLNQVTYTDKSKVAPKEKFVTRNLRASHFALGTGKPDFVSQNMLQFRNPAYVK